MSPYTRVNFKLLCVPFQMRLNVLMAKTDQKSIFGWCSVFALHVCASRRVIHYVITVSVPFTSVKSSSSSSSSTFQKIAQYWTHFYQLIYHCDVFLSLFAVSSWTIYFDSSKIEIDINFTHFYSFEMNFF